MTRIYHPWTVWECVPGGMYETIPPYPMTSEDATTAYASFLADMPRFSAALSRVLSEWPLSCEHFLSNESMNRLAWLGQASMCIETRVPACFKGGFHKLNDAQKRAANAMAASWLRRWLRGRNIESSTSALGDCDAPEHDTVKLTGSLRNRVLQYERVWEGRGYEGGIPDDVPHAGLYASQLVPSYRALCMAILKNDHDLLSLGGVPKKSAWYGALKRIEIAARPPKSRQQLELFQ